MSDGKTPVGNETCTLGGFWRLILCMPPEEGTNTGDATERVYRPPATKGNRGDASNSNPLIGTKTATVNDEYSDADNDEEEMTKSEKRRWKAELRAQQEEEKRREERLAELKEVLNNNAILKGRESRVADLEIQRELSEVRHKFSRPLPQNLSTDSTDNEPLSRSTTPTRKKLQNGLTGFAASSYALQAHTPVTADEAEHLFDRLVNEGINCTFYLPSRSGAAKPKKTLIRCPRGEGMMHLDVQTSASSSRTKTLSFEMASEIGEIKHGKGPLISLPEDTPLENVLHVLLVDKPEISLCFDDSLTMSMVAAGLNRHVALQHAKARNNSSRLSMLSATEQQQQQQEQQQQKQTGKEENAVDSANLGIAQSDVVSPTSLLRPQSAYLPQQSSVEAADSADTPASHLESLHHHRSMSINDASFDKSLRRNSSSDPPRYSPRESPRSFPRLPNFNLLSKDLVKLTAFYWIEAKEKGYMKSKKVTKLLTTFNNQTMQIFLVPAEYDSCTGKATAIGKAAAEQKSLGIKLIKLFDAQWSPTFLLEKGFTMEASLNFSDVTQTARSEDGEDGDIDITFKDGTTLTVAVQEKERKTFIQSMEAKRRAARVSR